MHFHEFPVTSCQFFVLFTCSVSSTSLSSTCIYILEIEHDSICVKSLSLLLSLPTYPVLNNLNNFH